MTKTILAVATILTAWLVPPALVVLTGSDLFLFGGFGSLFATILIVMAIEDY